MTRVLPFDDHSASGIGRSELGAVLRNLDFIAQWEKGEQISLDLALWVQEESMGADAWRPVHWFCSAVTRTCEVSGEGQLAAESPELFRHLCRFNDASFDLASFFLGVERESPTVESVRDWFEVVKRLWPTSFGIFHVGCGLYRDERGDFCIVRQQEVKLDLPRPRIFVSEDVSDNRLPLLGDVTESFEALNDKLQAVATAFRWQEPHLLVPWRYKSDEQGVYTPSEHIFLIRGDDDLTELRAVADKLRLEGEKPRKPARAAVADFASWLNSTAFEENGWTPVYGVSLQSYDVKGGHS